MEEIIYKSRLLSSLEKVFADECPDSSLNENRVSVFKNETISFQIAYTFNGERCEFVDIEVQSDISDLVKVRRVELVPSAYPAHTTVDDNYLRTSVGLYPDLLTDLFDGSVMFMPNQWRSIWIDIEPSVQSKAGIYDIKVLFKNKQTGEIVTSQEISVEIYNVQLPEQKLIRTEWFHGDCLANFYNVDVFSEKHWEIIENFISTAVKRGINMILTPQFTPPLDTAKGGERTTIQLIDIEVDNGKYKFSFDKLKRWVDICKKVGVKYFEMSHLFTQWGAIASPKIMATVNGEYKRLFGWETRATSEEYKEFLHTYLPQLIEKLKDWGIDKNTYFHISDEPSLEQLQSYKEAKEVVNDLLKDFVIIDALSDYEFYKTGVIEKPVSANDHIHTFLDNGVENMWSYYCTGQWDKVSNRFMSMPSARNRIYGVQLYKYKIEGALHWGYNFYNSQYSIYNINPYITTDALGIFPSGDAFLVYPKNDGTPEESIRMMVQYEAMTDLRALQWLEELTSYDYVMSIIENELDNPITFKEYPKDANYLISLRQKINEEIIKRV